MGVAVRALMLAVGLLAGAPAAWGAVQLPPVPLPAPRAEPALWFSPGELPALRAKRGHPAVAVYEAQVRAFVDQRLSASPSSLSDDALSKLAKGAALLERLGDTPPQGASYRDVAVRSLLAIRERTPPGLFGGGSLQAQYDCGRLQSMAEARDMLRGTGVAAADLAAIDARIAEWAHAFLGDPFLPHRRNNLSIKAGAALVTAALALPQHPSAGGWLSTGVGLVNDGLANMASSAGWYREGFHYLSYALNNLLPAAYHVRNAAGVDWFGPLRPLVEGALALRQPSGDQPAFEDAVPLVAPWVALAPAYASDPLGPALVWAWEESRQQTSNFGVQQLHAATKLLVIDPALTARPPDTPATRFVGGDAHGHVLATGWGSDALQASMLSAIDYSDLAILDSRHNVQNPFDVVIAAFGADVLVTSTGGPEITQSANRQTYLAPASRCTILVNGTAPFLTDPAAVVSDRRLRSRPHGAAPARLLDLGRTAVTGYAAAHRARRTLGLVGEAYVLALDEVEASQPVEVTLPWRGRAGRQVHTAAADRVAALWTHAGVALDLTVTASAPLSVTAPPGLYAPRYGVEEAVEPVHVSASGQSTRLLTLLHPRDAQAAPLTAWPLGGGGGAVGFEVDIDGARDTIAAGPAGAIAGLGPVLLSDAELVVVRERQGAIEGLALAGGRSLRLYDGAAVELSAPATLAVSVAPDGLLVSISQDQGGLAALTIDGLLDPGQAYAVEWEGQSVAASRVERSGANVTVRQLPPGGGALRIEATGSAAAPGASSGGGGSSGGGCRVDGAGRGAAVLLLALAGALLLGRAARRRPA